ncbi:glycosyltransferase family 4 protein [bacterium]|nr:glycosyltransferase family 4 protein [bacterium]
MKKICMVTSIHSDFNARIFKMARSVAGAGFEIDLICPWNVEEGMQDGIYYRPFPPARSRLTRYTIYPKIWRMLSDHDYALYHFHDLDILPLFALFKLLKKKPMIYDIHENYAEEMLIKPYIHPWLRPLVAFSVKWVEWVCVLIIKNLVVVVESLEKTYPGSKFNIIKVRNFATRELEKSRNDDYDVRSDAIVFTGSQYIGNGSLLFLEIARKIHSVRPDVKFYCVDRFDNTAFRQKFLDTIKEHNLEDVVQVLSNIIPHEIMSYINLATIGISPNLNLPNQRKGIHTKIFEYMAGGIPVVASNHPYHEEFIEKNRAGLLADSDCSEQFVEKIIYLVDNREKAKEMGLSGLKTFREKYCWEKEEEKLIQMYQRILKLS